VVTYGILANAGIDYITATSPSTSTQVFLRGIGHDEVARAKREGGKQRHLRLERSFGRGDTLYVGSRVSNYYGRVYDKHRESGDEQFRRCWRYEIECKGDGAQQARKAVNAATDVQASSAALVHDWFSNRGCSVRFRPQLADHLAPVGAHHSDLDTWLTWLLQGVRPVVQRCLLYVPRETIESILFAPGVIESDQDARGNRDALLPPIVD
jgi:hypothetical protein